MINKCYYCGTTNQVTITKGTRVYIDHLNHLVGDRSAFYECSTCYDTNKPYNDAVSQYGVDAVDNMIDLILASKKR